MSTITSPIQAAFSAGEISPLLHRRFDYQRFQTGLAVCRGFLPMRQGGFTRAPGSVYDGTTRANARAKLLPFSFAADDALVLEFTPGSLRFWRYGQLVIGAGGQPYEIDTPFDAASLDVLQWQQSADVIYLADGARPIQKLSRFALANWTIAAAHYKSGPFQVQNLEKDLTVQASAATGTITLTASAALFEPAHTGTLMRLVPTDFTAVPLWTSDTDVSVGERMRNDGNTYELVTGTKTKQSPPIHTEGTERVCHQPVIEWKFIDDGAGIVEITGVLSPTSAQALVIKTVPQCCVDDPTYRWSEGAWSNRAGWPSALTIHDQRFVAGGTDAEPRTTWFSTAGDYGDFEPSTEADESFAYAIAGQASLNRVLNYASGRTGLHIFALGEEYSARSTGDGTGLSIESTAFGFDSQIGSAPVRPVSPDGAPIFISRDRTRLFQIAYSFENDANRARELSLPSEHFGQSGFEEIVWAGAPWRLAWLRLGDGDLAAMLYDPSEDVLGWARLPVAGGVVESMAVSPAADGSTDVLTLAIARQIGGQTVRTIERLSPIWGQLAGAPAIHTANHAWCARHFPAGGQSFDMAHLAGEVVHAWTDEGQFGPLTVPADGQLTLEVAVGHAFIGLLDATHYVETLDIQAAARDGSTLGRRKRLHPKVGVALHRTAQGRARSIERTLGAADRPGPLADLLRLPIAQPLTQAFSGVGHVALPSGQAEELALQFWPSGLAPMTVTALVPRVEEGGA